LNYFFIKLVGYLWASMIDLFDYTIGWICAIETAYVAAQAFLDEEHPVPNFISRNDPNEYTLGRMGHHNVVIAVLSQGYGTSSAASVATHMVFSFLNIRVGLLVGIAGGAPSIQDDIRLGDVVVSTPGNGHNGVLPYDMGVAFQGQEFEIRRVLNAPPFQLLTATNGLRAQHEIQGHRLQQSISEILDRSPKLRTKFGRPDPDSDRLYLPHVVHPSGQPSHCTESCGNDPSTLVLRPERTDAEDDIVIHYGLIASGNTLCRDTNLRDKFAKKRVLCFEMEAAGVMNHFPCIVIRAICDYSDSHKNKDWQGYAAMTAAAYAKDLLKHVAPSHIATKRKMRACGTKWLTGHYLSLLMETVFVFMLFLLVETILSKIGLKREATGVNQYIESTIALDGN
jgi:nucleoside phosphorylase